MTYSNRLDCRPASRCPSPGTTCGSCANGGLRRRCRLRGAASGHPDCRGGLHRGAALGVLERHLLLPRLCQGARQRRRLRLCRPARRLSGRGDVLDFPMRSPASNPASFSNSLLKKELVMTTVRSLFSRARARARAHAQPRGFAALAAAGLLPAQAMAQGLPSMEAPSRGEGDGLLTTLQNYVFDFGALGGLILATVAFLIVAIAAIATFNEARVRGVWSKFGVVVVVGVVLIIAIIWLATKASEIL